MVTPRRSGNMHQRGGRGLNFCAILFSFDENMYIVQNIYIKYTWCEKQGCGRV